MKLTTVFFCCACILTPMTVLADNDGDDDDRYHQHWSGHETVHHGYHHPQYRRHFRRHHGFYDDVVYGRVIDVERIYRIYDEPVRERHCRRYPRGHRSYNSYTGTIAGAVIGGALGHTIGDAHGDADAAAVAGGLLGAAVGHDIDHRATYTSGGYGSGTCRVSLHRQTRRELVEYKVRYRYNGRIYVSHMNYDPGEWVKLDVDIDPA